jgi:CspA family cold shock protein
MHTGIVKTFNAAGGQGVVVSDEERKEFHIRASSINMEGIKTLTKGQRISFDIARNPKGDQAVNIKLLAEESS